MITYARKLQERQGWSDGELATMLAATLSRLVTMGSADESDLKALLRREAGLSSDHDPETEAHGSPDVGDVARMHGEDVTIEVESVPTEQPEHEEGVWVIFDQYGERHRIVFDDHEDGWYVAAAGL